MHKIIEIKIVNINVIKINHFLFIPLKYNKEINIIMYIITLPVSGSRNVSIEGIKVIIKAFTIAFLSL